MSMTTETEACFVRWNFESTSQIKTTNEDSWITNQKADEKELIKQWQFFSE